MNELNYEVLAVELVREIRGKRSLAELSRRAGYRSNIAQRWEARRAWPTASTFLSIRHRLRPASQSWIERFFKLRPSWLQSLDPHSPEAVAAFLRHLRGSAPITGRGGRKMVPHGFTTQADSMVASCRLRH